MLELWFDFSCPYAYLASRRAAQLGVPIDWRPMLLGGVFRGIGAGAGPMATQGFGPAKAIHNVGDMHRWAQLWNEPFRLPAAHPMRTVRALRVLLGLPHSRWPAAIDALYAAYWQRAEDITSDAVIAAALAASGATSAEITTAMTDNDAVKTELKQRTDEAIALGIFGAPAWVFRRSADHPRGSHDLGRTPPNPNLHAASIVSPLALLIWGQDRMPWVEAALAGWDPEAGPPPGGPRPFATTERAAPGATLEVYFDVASPFAYLGLTQLAAIAAMGVVPRLVPILLGALFRDIGQADVPLFAMPPAKARYIGIDMTRWASWWGVPFKQPARFPQRTITAQRLILLAADAGFTAGCELAIALGRAMWAEQRDLEDPATLLQILESVGLSSSLLQRTIEADTKNRLIANTAEAKAKNVFGVPTYIVNGKHLFWGQDRLDLVAKTLGGWEPWQP